MSDSALDLGFDAEEMKEEQEEFNNLDWWEEANNELEDVATMRHFKSFQEFCEQQGVLSINDIEWEQ